MQRRADEKRGAGQDQQRIAARQEKAGIGRFELIQARHEIRPRNGNIVSFQGIRKH